MPTMIIKFIVKDTISPTTHVVILASFCSSLHKKNFVLYLLKKNEKKNIYQKHCFNNLRTNDILKNVSCCKF